MLDCFQDPDYWRRRAEEARLEAETCRQDPKQCQHLLRMADDYERFGNLAEQRFRMALR